MELQEQVEHDWSRYYSNHHLHSELKSSSAKLENDSDYYCSIWTHEEPRLRGCNSYSFAVDARKRLEHLKSGYKPTVDRPLCKMTCQSDIETKREESALDLVELIDVEDEEEDEESWLYKSPKQRAPVGSESALRWCRHVLDNPSPEMEAARRVLINRLDRSSHSPFYRRPAGRATVGSSTDNTPVSSAQNQSDSSDNKMSISSDPINPNYRLQDMTDVHIMACLQEASLRQNFVSVSSAASSRRGSEAPAMLPSYFNSNNETVDGIGPGSNRQASSSCRWQQSLSSLISSTLQSPTSAAKPGCQSPKLARLHQQVTQFKLLKRAQNQATSTARTRSPLRTSLRSLQAVRNSRSLETDDWHPADHTDCSPPGVSYTKEGSSGCSPSLSAASRDSSGLLPSVRDSVRTAAIKGLHRSQSLSPCRIPHAAKAHLSLHGRVFASSERSTTVAWTRNTPPAQW
ncbi:SLAIN motif-containing protein-like [Betta splendens]|uniref:SLAIN motif-containing protein-like n=1 Tax=Betta splendens TaxID=158456 RepID=A0A6P7PFU8_BETSP|nr:SLAIN motif-containing protein-like [Betta splendens]